MITMLLSGLWHGAAWTFVVWGFIHGSLMVVERLTKWPERLAPIPGSRYLASLIVLVQVWIAWVYFKAHSLDQANTIVTAMLSWGSLSLEPVRALLEYQKQALLCLAVIGLRELAYYLDYDKPIAIFLESRAAMAVLAQALLIVSCVFFRGPGGGFIYFQF
jgi:D-alanyl-lipoteichoic acid acyltransferase DltB (MBOAT superfamily)